MTVRRVEYGNVTSTDGSTISVRFARMAKVVLDVVTVVFEDVASFVLELVGWRIPRT